MFLLLSACSLCFQQIQSSWALFEANCWLLMESPETKKTKKKREYTKKTNDEATNIDLLKKHRKKKNKQKSLKVGWFKLRRSIAWLSLIFRFQVSEVLGKTVVSVCSCYNLSGSQLQNRAEVMLWTWLPFNMSQHQSQKTDFRPRDFTHQDDQIPSKILWSESIN